MTGIFSYLQAAKKKGFSRIATNGLCALAIAVLIVGPFANIAEAALPADVQQSIAAAKAAAAQAQSIASDVANRANSISSNEARTRNVDVLNQQKVFDQNMQVINSALSSGSLSATDRAALIEQRRALVDTSNPNSAISIVNGAAAQTNLVASTAAKREGDLDAQAQARNADARAQTTGGSTANVNTPPKDGEVAKHPLEICIKDFKMSMCIAGIFYVFFVDLTSPIAYLAGALFDAFAGLSLMGGTYASAIIAKGWVIARDVANMLFVFILVYIAIMLILNLEGTGIARHIATVIGVALLINFSFFFTRAVIDVSNIFARAFYDNIVASAAPSSESFTVSGVKLLGQAAQSVTGSADIKSISEKVMAGINPQDLLSNTTFKKYLDGQGFLDNLAILLTLFFIFGIVNIILAFIFTMAAIQFLTRIVTLWFAIILSPLAFVTFALPGHRGHHWWEEWLDLLIKNAFYAPAFLFVVYIMVAMLDNNLLAVDMANMLASNASGGSTSAIQSFLNKIVGVIVRLAIVVGLFYSALKVGEFLSTHGASTARSWAGKLAVGGNARLVGGLGSFVGRNTVGWASYGVARGSRNLASGVYGYQRDASGNILKDASGNAIKKAGLGGFMARTVGVGVGRAGEIIGGAGARTSFDARGLSGIPGAKMGGDIAGKARAGGYIKTLEESTKRFKEIESARHDTPEEKMAREERIAKKKEEIGYDNARKVAVEDLAKAEKDATKTATDLAASLQRAKDSGNMAEADRIQRQIDDARRGTEVHRNRIAELDRQIKEAGGFNDADRKAAEVAELRSRGVHNLWGVSRRASDRAAYDLKNEKSKKDKFADAARDYLREVEPPAAPPAPPAGGSAPPPPPAGGGNHH